MTNLVLHDSDGILLTHNVLTDSSDVTVVRMAANVAKRKRSSVLI